MRYKVEGGQKLSGTIKVSGNKNSVFPCVAAALLTSEEVILENIPRILDVDILVEILKVIGVKVTFRNHTLKIHAQKVSSNLPQNLMSKLRGSIVLAGAILSRNQKVTFSHPGGDVIGKRSFEVHLEGFKSLGAKVEHDGFEYRVSFDKKNSKIRTYFSVVTSVTGTENLILASVFQKGVTILKNCTSEPHVRDLCLMLNKMGANIEGVGTNTLTIQGIKKLSGTKFSVCIDYLEVGTYAIASAITGGEVKITGVKDFDFDPILKPLSQFGLKYKQNQDEITFCAGKLKAIPKLITNIWPGFPTDMVSLSIVLATQSQGITLCHDWIFESRMFFVDKLIAMGANITIADPHRVLIYGPSLLSGKYLESPDIRAGMALVLAGLVAKGESIIERAELVERGYEDVVGKLKSLGAKIKKEV